MSRRRLIGDPQVLWQRKVADGATAIMGGGGNGNRNSFKPGAIPDVNPGTWEQGTTTAGSHKPSWWMRIDLRERQTDYLTIAAAFKITACSDTGTKTVTGSAIQAIAIGMTYEDEAEPLFAAPASILNNTEVEESDRSQFFSHLLACVPNETELSAVTGQPVTGNPLPIVTQCGFFHAKPNKTITNCLNKFTSWEFAIMRRPCGAVRGASEASPYPLIERNVSGLSCVYLNLSMVNAASAAFADNTTATLDGKILALHFEAES